MASNPQYRYDFGKAKDELGGRVEALCDRLSLSSPVRKGNYWFIQPDRHPDTSTLWVADHDGSWRHESAGTGGDVIALIAYSMGLTQFEALKWAYIWLGWQQGDQILAKPLTDKELAERDAKARKKAEELADKRERASKAFLWVWRKKMDDGAGTLAEAYMRYRVPSIGRLVHFPHALRFERRAEHTDPETGEVTEWPVMGALMAGEGEQYALHRTFMHPDLLPGNKGKAPVEPAKMIFGPQKGCMIRLTRGFRHLKPADAIRRGVKCPLIIGEGIETTIKVAAYLQDCRAWAAGTMGNMAAIGWPDHASEIVLLRDNDTHPAAIAGFQRVHDHWLAQAELAPGRVVHVESSDKGSDFADE